MTSVALRFDPRAVRRRRPGFTLVELLVVMVIIGILIGLLIPVIGMARATVQEATLTTEVATISQALQGFKTNFQTGFPPDFSGPIVVGAQPVVGMDAAVIDQYMSRLFRYRDRTTDVPRDQVTGLPLPNGIQLYQTLDPSEALWFWLRGFSDDQANPLWGPVGTPPDSVQRTPIFEFDESRLFDRDGDGFMEYYPRFASDLPYVYLVHYNYLAAFQAPNFTLRQGTRTGSTGIEVPCPRPYLKQQNSGALVNFLQVSHYAEAQKFQILCAGLDNSFGVQLDQTNFGGFTFPLGPYPDKAHLDNVSNFAEGTLEDKLP